MIPPLYNPSSEEVLSFINGVATEQKSPVSNPVNVNITESPMLKWGLLAGGVYLLYIFTRKENNKQIGAKASNTVKEIGPLE